MSFDVFVESFTENPADRSREVRAAIAPWYEASSRSIVAADGSADIEGMDSDPLVSLMFTHVDGRFAWDAIYAVAVAARWSIFLPGCPVCVVDEALIGTLPEELRELGTVLVGSGAELLQVVTEN